MKKYFITSDIHSYYSLFLKELNKQGFDLKNEDHILIICGDLFDRGEEAQKLLDFLLSIPEDRLILIKGNHEDLMDDLLEELKNKMSVSYHHFSNGTFYTLTQLTNISNRDLLWGEYNYKKLISQLKNYFKLVKRCKNYYELGNYIFVHGWIPHIEKYEDLSKCSEEDWKEARWVNGMQEWKNGWNLKNKIIVCGHWHTSYGHSGITNKCFTEFGPDAIFDTFKEDGIIALDACTAFSKKVNIKVLDI